MKLLDRILGKKETGTPCWVLAKEANMIDLVPGMIGTNLDKGIEISYTWLDTTKHRFLESEANFIAIKGKSGLPVYAHNTGELFGEGLTEDMVKAFNEHLAAEGKSELPCIGSEYYQFITKSNIGSQMIEALEEYREGTGISWKWILIVGGVLILGYVLYETGILQSLFGSITESVVK